MVSTARLTPRPLVLRDTLPETQQSSYKSFSMSVGFAVCWPPALSLGR